MSVNTSVAIGLIVRALPGSLPRGRGSRRCSHALVASAVLLCIVPGEIRAQSAGEPVVAGVDDRAEEEARPAPPVWVIRVHAGSFDFEPDGRLPGLGGLGALAVSVGYVLPSAPFLGFDFEALSGARSYDNEMGDPIFVSVNDETNVDTSTASLGLRFRFPTRAAVNVYAVGGVGYATTTMKVRGLFLFIPGTVAEDRSGEVTTYTGFGIEARFGSWGLSGDYRRFDHTGDFGDPFGVADVELGGTMLLMGGAWYPGR